MQPTKVMRVADVATIPDPACLYLWINSVISASNCSTRRLRHHQPLGPDIYLAIHNFRVGFRVGQYHVCGSKFDGNEPLLLVFQQLKEFVAGGRAIEWTGNAAI